VFNKKFNKEFDRKFNKAFDWKFDKEFFFILTRFNTYYESMQDSIYCSERCVSVALFSYLLSLFSALYTVTVFNARTLWTYFFSTLSFFHLSLWWCHSLKLIQYACQKYHLNDCCQSSRSWFLEAFSSS